MQLAQISPSLHDYLDMERHRNEGSPSGFSQLHRPNVGLTDLDRGERHIELPLYEVKHLHQVGILPSAPILFPVHPDMSTQFQEIARSQPVDRVPAAATSSGRTLLADVMGAQQFVKLSYHGLLGRVHRRMTEAHLVTAIEVSSTMRDELASKAIDRFAIQHEYFGAIAGRGSEWGFVLRELQPFPYLPFEFRVPAFSLLSRRFGSVAVEPLLTEILRLRPELDDGVLFYEEFLQPIVDAYFLLLRRSGLQIEAHAQNLIYHFDKFWHVVAIVYRDMESVDKDISLIEELGLSTELTRMPYKELTRRDPNYAIKHSFMYDFKLGEYLLGPLCDFWSNHTGKSAEDLDVLIRDNARSHLANLPTDLFPPDWYDYRAEVFEGQTGRPYVAHPSPRFR